jgi:hypothetical protein
MTLTDRQKKVVRYALRWLRRDVLESEDIAVEAAQEVAPETQFNDEPLRTLVADEIEVILRSLDSGNTRR